MDSTVNHRIKLLVKSLNLNVNSFATKIGVSQPRIDKYIKTETAPALDFFEKLYKSYPTINLVWLIIGDGPMWLDQTTDNGELVNCEERNKWLQNKLMKTESELENLKNQLAKK